MSDLAEMVPDLIEKTRDGRLEWEEPDFNEFEAKIAKYKLFLKLGRDGLSLTLFDANGRPLDAVYSLDGGRGFDLNVRTANLQPLYDSAKRKARRVDQALAEVESALKTM